MLETFVKNLQELGPLVGGLAILLVVLPIAAGIGAIYLWRLWLSDERRPRSWILRDLAFAATVKTAAAGALGYLALRRLFGLPPHPEGLIILVIAVVVLEVFPIYYAVSAYVRQRQA